MTSLQVPTSEMLPTTNNPITPSFLHPGLSRDHSREDPGQTRLRYLVLQVVPLEWQCHPISSRHTTICLHLYPSKIEVLITRETSTKLFHIAFLFLPLVVYGQFVVLFPHVNSFVETSGSLILMAGKASQRSSFYSHFGCFRCITCT